MIFLNLPLGELENGHKHRFSAIECTIVFRYKFEMASLSLRVVASNGC